MNISLLLFDNEIDILVEFLMSDSWEYHSMPNPTSDLVRRNFEEGHYCSEDSKTFWILTDDGLRIGFIRIFDLTDGAPLFDIRIHKSYRGLGAGTQAIRLLVHRVFTDYPNKERIEGYTRQDNYAMRKAFLRCGFVKEAHHRKAWPSAEGALYDSIGYGILRKDWETDHITPLVWDDMPDLQA